MLRYSRILQFQQFSTSIHNSSPKKIVISQIPFVYSPKILRSQMGSYTTDSQLNSKLLFRQLFEKESSTYTYLLADATHPEKPALVL